VNRWDVEQAVMSSDLPAPSRLVVLVLLTHVTNGTLLIPTEYAPSLTDLARETGLSRSVVADHLNRLEAAGWVERRRPTTRQALAAGARTSYRIARPTSPGAGLVREPDQSESRTSVEEPQVAPSPGAGLVRELDGGSPGAGRISNVSPTSCVPTGHKEGGAGETTTTSAPKKRAAKKAAEHPEFDRWYRTYPVRKERAAAARAFTKAVAKVADIAELFDGVERYVAHDPAVARGFVKNPATWLNKECWRDEYPAAQRQQPRGGALDDVNAAWTDWTPDGGR
jgi:DNA-binding Lrp family transcriptional regulator